MITKDRRGARDKRHYRLRRFVRGSAARPRLAVFRSLNHIYAQLIDDDAGVTVLSVDSRHPSFRGSDKRSGGNVSAATAIGQMLAEKAKERGIERVVFDRGGYKYHGRVKALAEAARAGGLAF
jgi:large subunit ribosomal protein L18